jgi:GT2 family glycosyltransferase
MLDTIASAQPIPSRSMAPSASLLKTPLLSVVIVNYCQWENTGRLVKHIRRSGTVRRGAVEVVVVDNHSPPHPLMRRLRRWPGVSLRRWGRNRGFARAVNEGYRLSRGGWVLLLNPDLKLADGFLPQVLHVAADLEARDPRAGIVGFQLLNSDGSPQCSAGAFPTLPGTLAGLLRPRARRKYLVQTGELRQPVSWVTGCCLLVRRECLVEVGGLDQGFFLYYEDVDLCRRARACGWSVWFDPRLRAVHHDPLHLRPVPPALRLITRHGLLSYAARHWPGWQLNLLSGIVRVEAWARRWWARWRGDRHAAALFRQMGKLARDLARGDARRVQRRLRHVIALGDPRK